MHIPTLIYLIAGYLEQKYDIALPEELVTLVPNSDETVQLTRLLSEEQLTKLLEIAATAGSGPLINLVLVVMHTRAAIAAREGRNGDAERAFRAILTLSPTDPNVRSALAVMLQHAPEEVVAILDPVVEILLPSVESHRTALGLGALSAFLINDYDFILRIPEYDMTLQPPKLRAVMRRMRILIKLKRDSLNLASTDVSVDTSKIFVALTSAHNALDEHAMTVQLTAIQSLLDGDTSHAEIWYVPGIVLLCALAFEERWPMAWQAAQSLLAQTLLSEGSIATARVAWTAYKLPAAAFTGVLVRASGWHFQVRGVRLSTPELGDLANCISEAPLGLLEAHAAWRDMLLDGRLEDLATFGPIDFAKTRQSVDELEDITLASLSVPPTADQGAPLWYFLTWHEHVGKLLRLIGVLYGKNQTIVVSIGGAKPPESIGIVSSLLLIDHLHILLRPVVTWGGPKLLYQNALEAFDAFDRRAEGNAWFQIICNRTYPLLSSIELRQLIGEQNFILNHPSIPPPPAWRHEWPDEVVDDLPNIFDAAFRDVLESHTLNKLRPLAFDNTRLEPLCFNFSSKAQVLDHDLKDGSHQYSISPYSADMRWMSFARMVEFIDTSTENNHTYSRKLPLHILKWIYSVLIKHTVRTGDPFVLMNHRYIQTVMHDPNCIELFSAMNLGFGPEMNFMDTVSYSPQYNLRDCMGHQYHRNERYEATDEDIGPANSASTIERRFFMRKTSPKISENFIRYFSNKISQDWPLKETTFLLDVVEKDTLPEARLPGMQELLDSDLADLPADLRTLTGTPIGRVVFRSDNRIWLDTQEIGDWHIDGQGLAANFQINGWNNKLYERPMSNADTLSLAPAEIVSARNGWGLLIDLDLATMHTAHVSPEWVIEPCAIEFPIGGWTFSRSAVAALLDAFISEDLPDYPTAVRHKEFTGVEFRQVGELLLALASIGGYTTLLRYTGFVFAAKSGKAIFKRALIEDAQLWDQAIPVKMQMAVAPSDISGRYTLRLLDRSLVVFLDQDGRILEEKSTAIGWWFADHAAIRLFGIPGLRTAWVRQFQLENGKMRLSGWGWRNIQEPVTFVLESSDDL